MKKNPVLHPFLLAVFPVLFLYSHNITEVGFSDVLPVAAIALSAATVLLLAARLFYKDIYKAGVFVFLTIVLFYSYGRVLGMIQSLQLGSFALGRNRYMLPVWATLFIGGIFLIRKTGGKGYGVLNKVLNIIAVSLMVVSLFNIGIYKLKTMDTDGAGGSSEALRGNSGGGGESPTVLRDVYYIILDGYAGARTLEDLYDFDNDEFEKFLGDRGFYLAGESRSNYAQTFLSLASSLNMEYVNDIAEKIGTQSADRSKFYQMIKDSAVRKTLKAKGYKFVHFSSGWGATNYNKLADINFYEGVNEFLSVFIQTTLLLPFEKYLIADNSRQRVLNTFSNLHDVAELEGPKFVFAHIVSPHPPFLFGRDGEPVTDAPLDMEGYVWSHKDKYLNQLVFINRMTEKLIDGIISRSAVPPIIVLQADHGSASTFTHPDEGGWENPTEKMIAERMDILNAYFLPNGGDAQLYAEITPVNTFRLIFNHYFHGNHNLLKDISYFSSYTYPYKFIEVGNK